MKRKMIIVTQSDVQDCGPCALESIIRFYGGYVSMNKLRDDCFTTMKGTTVYHLVSAARKYGFDALAKKILDKDIKNITFPAIVHIHYDNGLEHFMCLYEIINDKYILMDPAKGKVIMKKNEFDHIFTGVLIELVPKNEIVYFEKSNTFLELLFKIISANKKTVILIILNSFFLALFTIIYSLYFKINYESIINTSKIDAFVIIVFLIILLFKIVLDYYKVACENYLNKKVDTSIISQFLNHIFNLPLRVVNNKSTGEIVTRINELYSVKDLFSELFISMFVNFILGFGALIIMFFINTKMVFMLLAMLLVYILVSILVNYSLYNRMVQNINKQTELNATIIENINMLNSYKNLLCEKVASNRNNKCLMNLTNDSFELTNFFNIASLIKSAILEIGFFAINTYGFYLLYVNKITIIDLILFVSLSSYFTEPIKNVISLLPKINFLRASYLKICDFIAIDEENLGRQESFINGDISFKNICFSYNHYTDNINNLNLTIKKGEKVLLRGPSGSGKSTICALLEKTYLPDSGEITIHDKNIADYSISTIRANITYVGQKENLFTGTIRDNITLCNKNSMLFDKVTKVCLIDEIVSKRHFRYESGINSNLSDLSGGEKQRIILARSLMRNSNIIILDETLSEVDINSEERIIKNIITFFPNKTILYVSHKNHNDIFDRVIDFESINNKTV